MKDLLVSSSASHHPSSAHVVNLLVCVANDVVVLADSTLLCSGCNSLLLLMFSMESDAGRHSIHQMVVFTLSILMSIVWHLR